MLQKRRRGRSSMRLHITSPKPVSAACRKYSMLRHRTVRGDVWRRHGVWRKYCGLLRTMGFSWYLAAYAGVVLSDMTLPRPFSNGPVARASLYPLSGPRCRTWSTAVRKLPIGPFIGSGRYCSGSCSNIPR